MKRRSLRRFKALPRRQRGAVLVLVVVAMAAILLMSALALDGGHMLMNKARLQNAVDAAALSGAKTLSRIAGEMNSGDTVATDARDTLLLNVDDGTGNEELAAGILKKGGVANFARVEFSSSVYGPFAFKQTASSEDRYVRITVPEYGLVGFFWSFVQRFGSGSLGAKAVAAVATAGPSPSAAPCDLAPLMVCGNPTDDDHDDGSFWGYEFGEVQVLKSPAGATTPIGPGNFQLIDLEGTGKSDVRDALAGGVNKCLAKTVVTETGVASGPAAVGLNVRFNIYEGEMNNPHNSGLYPPDLIVKSNSPGLSVSSGGSVTYGGALVDSDAGNLSTSTTSLYDYHDWFADTAACATGASRGTSNEPCLANGVAERRMLKVVVGNCTSATAGKQTLPILGYGCFFVLQPVANNQSGNNDVPGEIFGQFISECDGDGVASPNPSEDMGPLIIQLYKSYLTGKGTPSTDS